MAEEHHDSLSPPPPGHHAQDDPGAHELEPESDDNFTDAQSQTRSRSHSRPASPIPITRVERVDHEAAYGEVPGTDAYEMRTEDARPDEIAFIPEGEEKLDTAPPSGAVSPGGQPIPRTVVEEVPASPVLGVSRSNTLHSHKRNPSDALPDLVLQVEDTGDASPVKSPHSETLFVPYFNSGKHDSAEKNNDTPGSPTNSATSFPSLDNTSDHVKQESHAEPDNTSDNQDDEAEDDGFGDFDNFEQGDEDAEFGDFDEADFQEASEEAAPTPVAPVQSLPQLAEPLFPVLDFSALSSLSNTKSATAPYLDALFPIDEIDTSTLPEAKPETPIFLTQRSASLWSQLVAAPPLQPPNWIRSRIRRLFLVSLGVPVDLDEILPASKQKKLVLPSTGLGSGRSSTDLRASGGSVQRLKDSESNGSRTSVDSQGRPKENRNSTSRRKGPPAEPQLDLVRGRQLCSMTEAAMDGLTMEELKEHVNTLEAMEQTAKEVLEYWTKRTDEKLGDREAFEGVIENLVQHARKIRK